MKNIYILEASNNTITGVDIYFREFIYCLKHIDNINIHRVSINSNVKEITIEDIDKVRTIKFPPFEEESQLSHKIECYFLKLFIEDTSDLVFFINYCPNLELIKQLKKTFPKSKIILIIHDFFWLHRVLGNIDDFNERKKINTDYIHHAYKEGLLAYNLTDKIVCLSKDTYELLNTSFNISLNKLFLIPNGLQDTHIPITKQEKTLMKKEYNIDNDNLILLFVGRCSKTKGIHPLIDGFSKVLEAV